MTRKHSHRGMTLRLERRAVRLEIRADVAARRSARQYGVVVSLVQMVELRHAITRGPLPDTVRYVGRTGAAFDAYVVDFNGVHLVALHDRRGQLIAVFMPEDHVDLSRPEDWRAGR